MLTVKHVDEDGTESIFEALSVAHDPDKCIFTGYGSPGPDEGARKDGVLRYESGRVYVTNENGKTVGIYILSGR
jgi:hypothetical protein